MSALSNRERKIYADGFASLDLPLLLFQVGRSDEDVRDAEIKVARAKAIRSIVNRELKRRKRKEKEASA